MPFMFVGGSLPLDFTNTVSWHTGPEPYDHLQTPQDLADWAEQAGIPAPAGTLATLDAARELREALFRSFLAVIDEHPPDLGDVDKINAHLRAAMSHLRLTVDLAWGWDDQGSPDLALWTIARQGAELLASPDLRSVSICQADNCGWLFLDRRHLRRWCTKEGCGNRAKAARHYQRVRARRMSPSQR
ncbi:ABATE domain-containing protein [Nonomuraea sp. NPDC001636]|uniref:CGNR zinc finger domain-containing protein n=1 Tax=Nonomuraea sp. NPDC001636 TaxID=3154391 RepID=UPI00332A14E0